MTRPPIICLTPVKNEAWILERFFQAASLWADYIVVADQQSSDDSRAIAARFPKVHLIENPSTSYDEVARQQLLIRTARSLAARSLLIALDADEFLSANFSTSPEWHQITAVPPGTVITFNWANIRPDLQHYWRTPNRPFGFVDDGREHTGQQIHNHRVPTPPNAPEFKLHDVHVLHYQYVDWARMQSKHRWYQCWERVQYPKKRAVDIYRRYHHMAHISPTMIHPLPKAWTEGYYKRGITLTSFAAQPYYWWDVEVLNMFARHGEKTFRKEAIWDCDWTALARKIYGSQTSTIADPRTRADKLMHRFLHATQPLAKTLPMLAFQKLLRLVGW